MVSRRGVSLGLLAFGLAGCGGTASVSGFVEQEYPAVANPGYDAWVAAFKDRAARRGIGAVTLDRAFAGAGFLPGVVDKDRNQTEFTRSTEDYLAIAASPDRVAKGRAALAAQGGVLAEIEARYGVEPRVVTAIWGLESLYGERRGAVPVISALSTLAYDGRRGAFFESQLVAALKILQNGDITPERMVGSWAGAMGHTQFIPTSYLGAAVDFRGDGRRDIWADDPTDALASAAAYLRQAGWTRGQPWGMEVRLPAGVAAGGRQAASGWRGLGVTRAAAGVIPDAGSARLIQPAGPGTPAFLLFNNFNVILRYNNAESYALGVGHLSDRIAGGAALTGTFPPDANGLTLADRQRLQTRLTAQGYDTGGAEGVIGPKTIAAIAAYQRANGLAVTGQPSRGLLAALG